MAGLTDTEINAEQLQIKLFRQSSTGRKISLLRSLSQTTIELSRRAIKKSSSEMPAELRYVGLTYGNELAEQVFSRWSRLRKTVEERMKSPPDLLVALIPVADLFDRLEVAYFLGGSIASSAHGVPRATADVDLIAALRDEHVQTLVDQLQNDYYIDEMAVRRAIKRHGSFNLIHLATMLKVDIFIPKADSYHREVSHRVIELPLDEDPNPRKFFLASAEDVIIAKLDLYRRGGEISEKQWGDILGVLRVQGQNLDFDYLKRWTDDKKLTDLFQRAIQEAAILP